jgi:hypothetical protein
VAPKIAGASVKMEPVGERHWPWAVASAVVATVAILTAGALYVFHSARRLPTDVIESGRQALQQLGEVAAAFRTGTVTTTFHGDAARLRGTTRLQFVELKQLETFERRDAESLLWGALTLPDVVVEARAPITYVYYVDLDKEWRFRLEGRDVFVLAPPVEWSPPAVDVSALRYEVKAGSVLRDEQLVKSRLQSELTALVQMRARQHVSLVREAGRRKVEAFVETWLVRRFGDGGQYHARVRFADEPPEPAAPTPAAPALSPPSG